MDELACFVTQCRGVKFYVLSGGGVELGSEKNLLCCCHCYQLLLEFKLRYGISHVFTLVTSAKFDDITRHRALKYCYYTEKQVLCKRKDFKFFYGLVHQYLVFRTCKNCIWLQSK